MTKKVTRVRAVVLAAVLALFGAMLVVVADPAPQEAKAHGTTLFPMSRSYTCYRDGVDNGSGGGLNPQNSMCKAALDQYGNYAFYNWFGNLVSNAAGQHQTAVPDGKLCGAHAEFAGMRPGGTAWPATSVQSGQTVTFRYAAWAAHPGKFMLYVTKNGWDPSQPLKWSDVEPFHTAVNPPKQSGPEGAEYYWNAQLPSGKSGRHIIFSVWERSDSPEAFYDCSDVNFGGSTSSPSPSPTPSPTAVSPSPTPSPTAVSPSPTPTPSNPGLACTAAVTVVNSWSGGYQADVKVTAGPSAISGWTVGLTGATVSQVWNATQSGTSFKNVSWNGNLAAGQSTSFGLIASGSPSTVSATCAQG
ncbi:lytic polysaccharide monooxygenase auxiliary activity family 9 protein [Myceligenerans crystallogenes]